MITAAEALILSQAKPARDKFLALFEHDVKKAAGEGKADCKFTHYDQNFCDVNALYSRLDEDKALTEVGKLTIAELRALGYVITLGLYYEERQFVDMRPEFTVSWSK